jgi:hypothetical protein
VGGELHAGRAVGGDELLDVVGLGLRELDLAVSLDCVISTLRIDRRWALVLVTTFQSTFSCLVEEW